MKQKIKAQVIKNKAVQKDSSVKSWVYTLLDCKTHSNHSKS